MSKERWCTVLGIVGAAVAAFAFYRGWQNDRLHEEQERRAADLRNERKSEEDKLNRDVAVKADDLIASANRRREFEEKIEDDSKK